MKIRDVCVITDGACEPNPGRGGYAALVVEAGVVVCEVVGAAHRTTNNRMELLAAIKGLDAVGPARAKVVVVSDSRYVVDGITLWVERWAARGWRTKGKTDVKNRDLWERLRAVAAVHQTTFEWVKGHAGHGLNERCDALAEAAARGSDPAPSDDGYEVDYRPCWSLA